MLYVKHSPDEVIALFDDVRLLKQGRIERRGAPKDLFVIATDAPRYRRRA
jgi:ABC-type molybdate transport system ATPase subunit